MTDQTDLQAKLLEQLQALQPQNTAAVSGWQQQPAAGLAPVAVSVPLKVNGVRVYFHFGPEHGSSPQALNALLEGLERAGLPLDRWQPRQSWGGGRGGYGGNRGGW